MLDEAPQMLVAGRWRPGGSPQTFAVVDHADGSELTRYAGADDRDVDEALQSSREGAALWRSWTALQRQDVMQRAAELLDRRLEAIARILTLEEGKTLPESRMELQQCADLLRWYGEEGKRLYGRIVPARDVHKRQMVMREPIGPVLAFAAWNYPGLNVMRKVTPAIAAGCSVIVKPSESTPCTAIALIRCLEEAGLPDHVVNLVCGDPQAISDRLLRSTIPRKLSFTGSIVIGIRLQSLAAETLKRCTMELGGHAPAIVFPDADIEKAAETLIGFRLRNAGQVCSAPSRFFVHQDVVASFIDAAEAAMRRIRLGPGLAEGTTMGPLHGRRRLDTMMAFVEDAGRRGARLVCGGLGAERGGAFYPPTLLADVPDAARVMTEETFGPIVPVASFATIDDVIGRANALPYGLASFVFTRDGGIAKTAAERLDAGVVAVNHVSVATPETPFGGVKHSGYGSEGGSEGIEPYLRVKMISESWS